MAVSSPCCRPASLAKVLAFTSSWLWCEGFGCHCSDLGHHSLQAHHSAPTGWLLLIAQFQMMWWEPRTTHTWAGVHWRPHLLWLGSQRQANLETIPWEDLSEPQGKFSCPSCKLLQFSELRLFISGIVMTYFPVHLPYYTVWSLKAGALSPQELT